MEHLKLNNGETVIIRKAVKTDAAAMLEYIYRISSESDFLTFGPGEFDVGIEQEEAFIDGLSKQNNALFLIAEVEGQIVGNLSFSGGLRIRTAHTGEFGVSVLKEYWGLGIGTELIRRLIDWSRASEVIRKINLKVRSDNSSAIDLYKKLGFQEEGRITRDFQINDRFFDSIAMGLAVD